MDTSLEANSAKRQIPKIYKQTLEGHVNKYDLLSRNYKFDKILISENRWAKSKDLRSTHINSIFKYGDPPNRMALMQKLGINPSNIAQVNTQSLGQNDGREHLIPLQSTREVKLRDFQYKLINNIISTRSKLYKYGHATSELCLYCEGIGEKIKDNTIHAFYQCPAAQSTWQNFKAVCESNLGYNFEMNEVNCIIGISDFTMKAKIVNELIMLVKKLLHSPINP